MAGCGIGARRNPLRRLSDTRGGAAWRGSAEELRQPPQVLRRCGEQHLVFRATEPAQPQPTELVDALHVGESDLHFLALAAGEPEGFGVGEGADVVAYVLVDVARDLAGDRRCALGLERADRAIVLARPLGKNASLIDDP